MPSRSPLPFSRQNKSLPFWLIAIGTAIVVSWFGIQQAFAQQLATPQAPACEHNNNAIKQAQISFVNPERTLLRVTCDLNGLDLKVDDANLNARLSSFSLGDIVNLTYRDDEKNNVVGKKAISVLDSLQSVVIRTSPQERFRALGCMSLLLVSSCGLALWGARGNVLALRELFVGADKRLSNSKSQAAFWFFILLTSYLTLTFLRVSKGGFDFVGGISIPANLLLLSGFSAFTYVGAKAITQTQVNKDENSKKTAEDGKASLADYVTDDDGNTDFGDFQMSVITLLAGIIFLLQIFSFMGSVYLSKTIQMPDVDATILSLFGLSQGGYLAKKAAEASGVRSAEPEKKVETGESRAPGS